MLTVVLEAVTSYDFWIWHAFFRMPGSHNNINVLDRSHLFSDVVEGGTLRAEYETNSHQYTMGYYLADRMYHLWATIVQSLA